MTNAPRKLTRSAAVERKRIVDIYKQAVGETCRAILMGGWNKLSRTEQRQQKNIAKAFEFATDCLRLALEETNPEPEAHIVTGRPLRDSDTRPKDGDRETGLHSRVARAACGIAQSSHPPSGNPHDPR